MDIPPSLSASALATFEACEAQFEASYVKKARTPGGTAATRGSLVHEVLEWWVKEGMFGQPFAAMEQHYDLIYPKYFSTREQYDDGLSMLKNWHDRENWDGREVLAVEVKKSFDLKLIHPDTGEEIIIPFNYIWDRGDKITRDDGDWGIEVVDYKSWAWPMSPDDLKGKVQPRIYALAAQIEYPDAPWVKVTMDQLRHDPVSIKFYREDNIATWRYLKDVGLRILSVDEPKETINSTCRWCIRNAVCDTFLKHAQAGGVLGVVDLEDAIAERAKAMAVKNAMMDRLEALDEFIFEEMTRQDVIEFETEAYEIKLTAGTRRVVDSERIAAVVPPEVMAKYGKLGVKDFDNLLKDPDLTNAQRVQIKRFVSKKTNKPTLKIKEKSEKLDI